MHAANHSRRRRAAPDWAGAAFIALVLTSTSAVAQERTGVGEPAVEIADAQAQVAPDRERTSAEDHVAAAHLALYELLSDQSACSADTTR